MSELLALLDGREVGTVRHERGPRSFVYADAWRSAPGAYPLSLSMPDRLADEVRKLRDAGLSHAVIDTLADALPKRAAYIAA